MSNAKKLARLLIQIQEANASKQEGTKLPQEAIDSIVHLFASLTNEKVFDESPSHFAALVRDISLCDWEWAMYTLRDFIIMGDD